MTPKAKAKDLVNRLKPHSYNGAVEENDELMELYHAKQCALIAIESEYYSLREIIFNLRSCKVIKSEKVYLHRLNELINEEKQVKHEINNL